MNIFGWLFSGGKAADKVLDGAVAGIDKIFHTSEEKADALQALAENWLELQKALGEETTIRSVTRRFLALLLVIPYVLLVLAAAVAYFFSEAAATFLFQVVEGYFGVLVVMVAGFYFGPPMIGRAITAWREKT